MGRVTPQVVVLDMDGVIVRSNGIKHRAMLALFDDAPAQRAAIDAYIHAQGGVARRDKIVAIHATILGLPVDAASIDARLARYAQALAHQLAVAPLIDGVADFIRGSGLHFHVSSSAPEDEVAMQLARSGLRAHVDGVYGLSTPKADALALIRERHRDALPVFFGDSRGDWQAAQATGTAFVAVVNERDNFAGEAVVKIEDFVDRERVARSMAQALREVGR